MQVMNDFTAAINVMNLYHAYLINESASLNDNKTVGKINTCL